MYTQLPVFRLTLSLLFATAGLSSAWAEEDGQPIDRGLVANPEIQKQIDVTIQAYADVTRNAPQRMGEAYPELWKLREMSGFDDIRLARQLILYEMRMAPPEEEKLMWLSLLFGFTNIGEQTLFFAVEPYIGTSDKALARRVKGVLDRVDDYRPTSRPNFDFYGSFLLDIREQRTPLPLIEHMYHKSPGRAMLICLAVYKSAESYRSALLAEHMIDDVLWKQKHKFLKEDQTTPEAEAELDKFSKHEHWAARLYVAEILRQEPEFRTDEIIKRLGKDSHPLVQKVIAKVAE